MANQSVDLSELAEKHGGAFAMIVRNYGRYSDTNGLVVLDAERAVGELLSQQPLLNTEECVMDLIWIHMARPIDEWLELQAIMGSYEFAVVQRAFEIVYAQLEPLDGLYVQHDIVEAFRDTCSRLAEIR